MISKAFISVTWTLFITGASSQNNCLTWKIRKDHALELSCKLYKVSEKVRIYDSKKRHDVHCPNQETCKAHSNEREEITFTLTVPSNYEDQWFCVNRNNTLSTNISTSKGFLSSTKLNLRGQLRTDKIYILSCSTCWNIDGLSVEFLVNDNSEDSVRYVDNKCYHRKQLCLENRCSCSPNEYNWTFDANNKPEIHNITCKMEFKDSERNCRKTQMITLLVDGQEFETVLAPSILHGECKDSSIQDKDNIILPEAKDGDIICNKCRHIFRKERDHKVLPCVKTSKSSSQTTATFSPPSVSLKIPSTSKSHAYCCICKKPGPKLIVISPDVRTATYVDNNI
ncbi:unnamed protein product [Mytilus coruscus]|uniref:Ig-like domain-containing protein n=1 Tax=Mytilus coruscus TaxID=42192 RepID=A0A6J8A6L9_MYTCO|nr:unnamed protein product [Mytilus coruscus]